MQKDQKARLQMCRLTHELLASGEPIPQVVAPLDELRGVIDRLEALGADQDGARRRSREQTGAIALLVERLRHDHVRPIIAAARAAHLAGGDEVKVLERGLAGIAYRDRRGLINAVAGMAQAATPHVDRLVATGLPKDFVPKLLGAVEQLRTTLDARGTEQINRVAATAEIRALTARGVSLVRLLIALARPILRADVAKLAALDAAIRLARRKRTTEGEGDDTTQGSSPWETVHKEVTPKAA